MAGIAPKYYYLTLSLLGICVVIGLYIAYRFQRDVDEDLAAPTEKDLLGPLEKAFYAGLMHEEEFHRIRDSLQKGTGDQRPGSKSAPPLRSRPKPAASKPITDPDDEASGEPVE